MYSTLIGVNTIVVVGTDCCYQTATIAMIILEANVRVNQRGSLKALFTTGHEQNGIKISYTLLLLLLLLLLLTITITNNVPIYLRIWKSTTTNSFMSTTYLDKL